MYKSNRLITYFDIPERDSKEQLKEDADLFCSDSRFVQILEAFPDLALVLNKRRQIIKCNKKALRVFNVENPDEILGKRFGEAFHCIHHSETEAGCGTSMFCRECGAAKALKHTREKQIEAEEECRIITSANNKEISYDFFVRTQPLKFKQNDFTIFSVRNISGDKRRETLERIFFHDVINTAGAVNGLANLLPIITNENERVEITDVLIDSSDQLLNEISTQREIRNAENGNLNVNVELTTINKIIWSSFELYSKHELAKGKGFKFDTFKNDVEIAVDKTLVIRSIGNLIKNALEATPEGGQIKLYAIHNEDSVSFCVYNNKVIPENVKIQLFQRSFSTKSQKGRGIGLYSVKLIVEQYLNGKVSFVSNEQDKTIFTIQLPQTK